MEGGGDEGVAQAVVVLPVHVAEVGRSEDGKVPENIILSESFSQTFLITLE